LRDFRARVESADGVRGHFFALKGAKPAGTLGFFVGYVTGADNFDFLKPSTPECAVLASIEPLRSALRRTQIENVKGTVRWTFEYIRWLNHRPPRFEFYEDQRFALVRHAPMREWPAEKWEHFSRNFYIETLAWLVRSGLVRRWRELALGAGTGKET
jgi:hypothetical protein